MGNCTCLLVKLMPITKTNVRKKTNPENCINDKGSKGPPRKETKNAVHRKLPHKLL